MTTVTAIRHWQEEAERQMAAAQPLGVDERQRLRREWQLSQVTGLARQDQDYALMRRMASDDGLLARQAEFFGGFRQCTRDLEGELLPAAIEHGDWPSFLLFALRAVHLRGLAVSLADEAVFASMVRHDRRALAADVVEQMIDPLLRARCRALIAAEAAGPAEIEPVIRELEIAPEPTDPRARQSWAETLETVARCLGPSLVGRWTTWLAPLTAAQRRQVWAAVLVAQLGAEPWDEAAFDAALEGTGDEALACLVCWVGDLPHPSQERVLAALRQAADASLYWHAWAVIQGQRRTYSAADEPGLLRALADGLPWSVSLIEAGQRLWSQLDAKVLDDLAARSPAPADRRLLFAALAVCRLEAGASDLDVPEALRRIDRLSRSDQRLHWGLRCLAIEPDPIDAHGALARVETYLRATRFAAPARDLALYLDLCAADPGRDLAWNVEQVLCSSSTTAKRLMKILGLVQQPCLLWHLLRSAETYAVAVAGDEASAFELRRRALSVLAARLCQIEGTLGAFDDARSRVLPSEEDTLRAEVAVAATGALQAEDAQRLLGGLRSRQLALRTSLLASQEVGAVRQKLQPAQLYASLATSDRIEDELRALALLLETPTDPAAAANRSWKEFHDPNRRLLACLDLAHHAVRFQEQAYDESRRDLAAVEAILENALQGVDRHLLVEALPELLALRLRIDPQQALTDFHQACLEVLKTSDLPWSRRQSVLDSMLRHLVDWCQRAEDLRGRAGRCEKVCAALTWLCRLPAQDKAEGIETLRSYWHWVLPSIVAAANGLPREALWFLRHPAGSRWAVILYRNLGIEPMHASSFFERLLAPRWLDRTAGTPWTRLPEDLREEWSWLTESQRREVEVCLLLHEGEGDPLHRGSERGAVDWQALVPLALQSPELLRTVLLELSEKERREAVLRLARWGGLDQETREVLAASAAEGTRDWLTVWHGTHDNVELPDPRWFRALGRLLRQGQVRLDDPQTLPLSRRLQRADRQTAMEVLAGSVAPALASHGRQAAETSLCLWLRAHLGYRAGKGHPKGRERLRELEDVPRLAREIARAVADPAA